LTKLNPKKAGTKYVTKACVAAAEIAKAAGYDVDKQLEKHYSIAKDAGNAKPPGSFSTAAGGRAGYAQYAAAQRKKVRRLYRV
jgi:hypothetical protein